MKIGFIGLGKLGLLCAKAMAKKHDVLGYDVLPVEEIPITNSIEGLKKHSSMIFIAVPTPHDELYDGSYPTAHLEVKDFDYSILKSVVNDLSDYKGTIVIISTVLPGTVRREFESIVPKENLIYNPYLIAMGSVEWDFLNPEMIIIGSHSGEETESIKTVKKVYSDLGIDTRIELGTWEEAECIKIFYNTYISAKIGLSNMFMDIAQKIGNTDVDVITKALSASTKRIVSKQYMKAGMGDAGACHPRDNIALRWLAKELDLGYDLFGAIMDSREQQALNIAKFLVDISKENNLPIYIHGVAYKPNVSYIDGSYSLLVMHYCEQLGVKCNSIDPLVKTVTHDNIEEPAVIFLAHNAEVTYNYTELNSELKLYSDLPSGSIVVDPWRSFTHSRPDVKTIYYGNSRKSV